MEMLYAPKPIKWGYNLWSLAGVSGYVYKFEILVGNSVKGPPLGESLINGVGESGCVV